MPGLGESVMRHSGIHQERRPLQSTHTLSTVHQQQDSTACATVLAVLILGFDRRVKRNFIYFNGLLVLSLPQLVNEG
jgi:hypothetical protein